MSARGWMDRNARRKWLAARRPREQHVHELADEGIEVHVAGDPNMDGATAAAIADIARTAARMDDR